MNKIEIPDLSNYPHLDEFLNKKDKYILDENKNVVPATLMEWEQFLENTHKERVVNKTEINGLMVSTVFLGLDHSFDGSLDIFETMMFEGKESLNYCERYSTWKEAEEGHQRAVQLVIDGYKEMFTQDLKRNLIY